MGVRRRKVSSVIEELKILKYDYNIDHVLWLDDDFLYNQKESIHLFNEMIKNNPPATNTAPKAACGV